MEPTERSMPRVSTTKSMPMAMMPAPEATWRTTFIRLRSVRNASDQKDATITSTRKMPNVP